METSETLIGSNAFAPGSGPAGIASQQDYAYCRQVMRSSSQRYSFASAFLPTEKRKHVEALYAFLRVGDDRVDVSHAGFASPLSAIEDWERKYWSAFETGDSPEPVMRAYLNTALECHIPREIMSSYFRAMKDDLSVNRFPTFGDLMHYMEGSALPVGRAMTHILGVRQPFSLEDAIPRADHLAAAMQLSNFLRDIAYDWSIGRVYLPLEDLERFRVTEKDLADKKVSSRFIELVEFQIRRTEELYEQARPGIKMLAGGRWGVMCGLEIYRAILQDIRRIRHDVFSRRADISTARKIQLVAKSWMATRS